VVKALIESTSPIVVRIHNIRSVE